MAINKTDFPSGVRKDVCEANGEDAPPETARTATAVDMDEWLTKAGVNRGTRVSAVAVIIAGPLCTFN